MVGVVVKAKVGGMEEDMREVNSRRLMKKITGVVQDVVRKRMYPGRFQDGWEIHILLALIAIMAGTSEIENNIEVRVVEMIPGVVEELGCYH